MRTVSKLASRLNWHRSKLPGVPQFYLMTDQDRFTDPLVELSAILPHLPMGAAVVLRHREPKELERIARKLIPVAHRLKLKVILAGPVRQALRLRCDGVHLSQARARLGPLRIKTLPPGFIVTAAAHDAITLHRATAIGAMAVLMSPVFPTSSHPLVKPLGIQRFNRIIRSSSVPVVALGGITVDNIKRLRLGFAYGIAAITAWIN